MKEAESTKSIQITFNGRESLQGAPCPNECGGKLQTIETPEFLTIGCVGITTTTRNVPGCGFHLEVANNQKVSVKVRISIEDD